MPLALRNIPKLQNIRASGLSQSTLCNLAHVCDKVFLFLNWRQRPNYGSWWYINDLLCVCIEILLHWGLSAKIFSKMLVNGRVNIFMITWVKCKVTLNLVECWWLSTIQSDNLSFHTSFIFYVTCSTIRWSDRHNEPQMLLYLGMFSVKSHFLQPLMTTARMTFKAFLHVLPYMYL